MNGAKVGGRLRELIARPDLERRVDELAAEVARDLGTRAEDDPLVVVGVLKGSVPFLADLVKRLDFPLVLDFLQASSYGTRGTTRGEVHLRKDLDLPIQGRDVLLVEDIVDSGHTANTLLDLLRLRDVRSLRLCTLLDKAEAREVDVPIDYRGFTIGNAFVVGYGLDVAERYRNLPYIAVYEPEAQAGIPSPS